MKTQHHNSRYRNQVNNLDREASRKKKAQTDRQTDILQRMNYANVSATIPSEDRPTSFIDLDRLTLSRNDFYWKSINSYLLTFF